MGTGGAAAAVAVLFTSGVSGGVSAVYLFDVERYRCVNDEMTLSNHDSCNRPFASAKGNLEHALNGHANAIFVGSIFCQSRQQKISCPRSARCT